MMSENTEKFLADILALSPALAEAHKDTIDYWCPERPPVIIAYAEVGERLADEFDTMDVEMRSSVFNLIESGMKSEDNELGTAIATGLIEGLIGRAARKGNWPHVRAVLGPLSLSHADAWHQS